MGTGTRWCRDGSATEEASGSGAGKNHRPTACGTGPRPWQQTIGEEAMRRVGQPSRTRSRLLCVKGRTAATSSSPVKGWVTETPSPPAGRFMGQSSPATNAEEDNRTTCFFALLLFLGLGCGPLATFTDR